MTADPIKCLAAAHIPLRRDKRKDGDWFERVDALAKDVKDEIEAARKDEHDQLRLLWAENPLCTLDELIEMRERKEST